MDAEEQAIGPDLAVLIREACLAGATEVMTVAPAEIVVEERLAGFCREPQCPNYGQSPSCPPHVAGPAGFHALRDKSRAALVVRIEVPSAVLFSDERREVMRLLHEITAGIERSAIARGYTGSKAFAGGSCKDLFCHDHLSCQILAGSGKCRNPNQARPSMSGFGINVAKMLQAAGCSEAKSTRPAIPGMESMSWLAGLVLIA
jgi:predicted metal-binding protein